MKRSEAQCLVSSLCTVTDGTRPQRCIPKLVVFLMVIALPVSGTPGADRRCKTAESKIGGNNASVPYDLCAICPGIQYLFDHGKTNFTIVQKNVSHCPYNLPMFTTRQGVVHGNCEGSRAFCGLHIQAPKGMFIIAHFKPQIEVTACTHLLCNTRVRSSGLRNASCTFIWGIFFVNKMKRPRKSRTVVSVSDHMYILHIDKPMLQLHFRTSQPDHLRVRYVSSRTGFIASSVQTGRRPMCLWIREEIKSPPGQDIMISFQQIFGRSCGDCVSYSYTDRQTHESETVDVCDENHLPVNVYRTSRLHVEVTVPKAYIPSSTDGYGRFRMLFSFHPCNESLFRLNSGAFNCTVDYYSVLRWHLECNMKEECEDGCDETEHCPYSSPGCKGLVASQNKCFKYMSSEIKLSGRQAAIECNKVSGRLASVKTSEDLTNFLQLFSNKTWWLVLIGYTSGWDSVPFMYSKFRKWADNTLIYTMNHLTQIYKPSKIVFGGHIRITGLVLNSVHDPIFERFVCETKSAVQNIFTVKAVQLHEVEFPVCPVQVQLSVSTCADGHLMHTFLVCEPNNRCRQLCTHNKTFPVTTHIACTVTRFTCKDGITTVPYSLLCDFKSDCQDGSDESFCKYPVCPGFRCTNCQCLPTSQVCDGYSDCRDDSDEKNVCPESKDMSKVVSLATVFVNEDGKGFQPLLKPQKKSLLLIHLDMTGYFTQQKMRANESCPDTHYQCTSEWLYCLPVFTRCNGMHDCIHHEDEEGCKTSTCPGFYRCHGSRVCVHIDNLCDGWSQCPQRDDEWLCNMTCPEGCLCLGYSFLCPRPFSAHLYFQLRQLDATGSGMLPSNLTNNIYLVFLRLSYCSVFALDVVNLPLLQVIDLSNNKLTSVTMDVFQEVENLRSLSLANNPLVSLKCQPGNATYGVLSRVDMSKTNLEFFDGGNLTCLSKVRYLDISHSGLQVIGAGGFQTLLNLKSLDIRGNSIDSFHIDLFAGLDHLAIIFASNYRLCCHAVVFDQKNINCFAPEATLSSCENLLSEVNRFAFWVVSILSILGNLACLFCRCQTIKNTCGASFFIFLKNLHVANTCMGIQTVIVSIANEIFFGRYLHYEDTWRNSAACEVARFLSILANEVPILIIWLSTFDLYMILCYQPCSWKFNRFSATAACAVAWFIGFFLASVPHFFRVSYQKRHDHDSVCQFSLLDRQQTSQNATWFRFSFVFNSVLYSMIFVGQILTYRAIPKYRIACSLAEKSAYSAVHILLKIAFTDAAAWSSFGIVSLLSLGGVDVSDELMLAIRVFVIPLNPVLNPVLCLWTAVLQIRQEKSEQRLLMMMKSRCMAPK